MHISGEKTWATRMDHGSGAVMRLVVVGCGLKSTGLSSGRIPAVRSGARGGRGGGAWQRATRRSGLPPIATRCRDWCRDLNFSCDSRRVESLSLLFPIQLRTRLSQAFFAYLRLTLFHRRQIQQLLLNVRGQQGQVQDLGHPRPSADERRGQGGPGRWHRERPRSGPTGRSGWPGPCAWPRGERGPGAGLAA